MQSQSGSSVFKAEAKYTAMYATLTRNMRASASSTCDTNRLIQTQSAHVPSADRD